MRKIARAFAALALAALTPTAWACGACIEDKVAATFDYAVVERAIKDHRVVVFAEIRGNGEASKLERAAATSARRARGVDASTVRSANAPLALSFVLDPAVAPERALASIAKSAAVPGLELVEVKVMR